MLWGSYQMQFSEYQELAQNTAGFNGRSEERLVCAVLALCGEAGELANHVKKGIWHGHGVDEGYVLEECGDLIWYLAEVCASMGLKLDDVAEFNIDKLRQRYPNGFSEEASRNRSR